MAKKNKDSEGSQDENTGNSEDSADNFGLPDIEYKPIDREQEAPKAHIEPAPEPEPVRPQERESEPANEYDYDDDEPRSRAPLYIGLIIAVIAIVGGILIYRYWYVPRGIKAAEEKLARELADKKAADDARLAKEREEAERKRADSIAAANAKPAEGTIETLTERTRRFFVVVSSDIDDDLLMDFAKKLSKKGVSTKIIPPVGDTKYYRLAIADFDTYGAAQSSADASKGEYGNALWVMRY